MIQTEAKKRKIDTQVALRRLPRKRLVGKGQEHSKRQVSTKREMGR
jgi:hypothetical protein